MTRFALAACLSLAIAAPAHAGPKDEAFSLTDWLAQAESFSTANAEDPAEAMALAFDVARWGLDLAEGIALTADVPGLEGLDQLQVLLGDDPAPKRGKTGKRGRKGKSGKKGKVGSRSVSASR